MRSTYCLQLFAIAKSCYLIPLLTCYNFHLVSNSAVAASLFIKFLFPFLSHDSEISLNLQGLNPVSSALHQNTITFFNGGMHEVDGIFYLLILT